MEWRFEASDYICIYSIVMISDLTGTEQEDIDLFVS